MRRLQVTIGGLMALVLLCAVGCAALRFASALWASLIVTLTLGLLALAILGAIYRRGTQRAFWVGFALFGWGYLLCSLAPGVSEAVRPHLATSLLLDVLYRAMIPAAEPGQTLPGAAEVVIYADPTISFSVVKETLETIQTKAGPTRIALAPKPLDPNPRQRSLRSLLGVGRSIDFEPFERVGHGLFALLAAWLGGLGGRFFATPRVGLSTYSSIKEDRAS